MSVGFCPCTGAHCEYADCYVDGCRLGAVSILTACEECGELHVAFLEPSICVACWLRLETVTVGESSS